MSSILSGPARRMCAVLAVALLPAAGFSQTAASSAAGNDAQSTAAAFNTIVASGPTTSGAGAKAAPAPTGPLDTAGLDAHFFPLNLDPASLSSALSIVYNGYRRSSIDPCGCVSHQLGGLDKEARIYERLKEYQIPALKVDAGGFFKEMPYEVHRTRTRHMMDAYADLGMDAINIGFPDSSAGISYLKDMMTSKSLPFISANIVDQTSATVFEPYKVVEKELADGQKVRVGIIGVTRARDPKNPVVLIAAGSPPEPPNTEYFVRDEKEAILEVLPKVQAESDIVVVLHYAQRSAVQKLAIALGNPSPVQVVVAGEYQGAFKDMVEMNGFRLVSGGFEGRQFGHLLLNFGADKTIASAGQKYVEVLQTIPPVPEISKHLEAAKAELMGAPVAAPTAAAAKPAPGSGS